MTSQASKKQALKKTGKRKANHNKKISEPASNNAPEQPGSLKWILRESIIVLLIAGAVYLFLILGTYHAQDPGFNYLGIQSYVENKGGKVGAFLADLMLTLLGYLAYLAPLGLLSKAFELFMHRQGEQAEKPQRNGVLVALRILGAGLSLVAGCALTSLFVPPLIAVPVSTGGVVGDIISQKAVALLSQSGAAVLLLGVFLVGLTLSLNIAWTQWSQWFVKHLLKAVKQFIGWSQEKIKQRQANKAIFEPVLEKIPSLPALTRLEALTAEPIVEILPSAPEIRVAPFQMKKRKKQFQPKSVSGDIPGIELLDPPDTTTQCGYSEQALNEMSILLESKLKDFHIEAKVEAVLPGPVVTRFEIQPAPGTKASRITNLAKDLARSLAVISVRVVEVIPGKTVVGIEIPNQKREIIRLSEVLASEVYDVADSPLTLCLGKDIAGAPVAVDLAKMPHLLVAGTTGSGKSVGLNAMLLSMLLKSKPDNLRLIMIDPKMLELSVYDDIPHLLTPVVTDMKEAANALRWCVAEMERRYRLMATLGVRNLGGYNRKVEQAIKRGEPIPDPLWRPQTLDMDAPEEAPTLETLPYIVVVVDEFADMIMIVGKKVEELIARIAQKARAAGIHLILATQRPSVDVITGLIKANVPSRIAFQVSSKIDSRTILDQGGAEQLLGHGDMLYLPPGTGLPKRVHGAFVADDEVHRVCDDWRARSEPDYLTEITEGASDAMGSLIPGLDEGGDNESDPLYDEAIQFVTETRKASISSVQRKLKIGYNRAARMIEAMEAAGVVSQMQSNGSREVLAPPPVAVR